MLDDLKYIHAKDSSDALGFAEKQPKQLQSTFKLGKKDLKISNVVFAGMGGSSLWAMLSQTWPSWNVPFEIWRRYDGPSYLSHKTLVVASSYSGTTEETLSALIAAQKAKAHIVVVARGGQLLEIAQKEGYPHLILPETPQPRLGTYSGFISLVSIMRAYGLTDEKYVTKTIEDTAKFLEEEVKAWRADVPTTKNIAKQLALEVAGTAPVIYADVTMLPAAYKWKISFNEAAKNVAWYGEIPEFSHNEFAGWSSHPVDKPYAVINLRSSYEHPQISKRFEISSQLLSGKRPHPHTVTAKGANVLEQALYLMLLGDFVAIYTGLLNGQDPTELSIVSRLKSKL